MNLESRLDSSRELPDLRATNREVSITPAQRINHLHLVAGPAPASVNREVVLRTATPRRGTNKSLRAREYLTEPEVEKMIKAAATVGRHPVRDAAAILIAYRHGLRAAELCGLRWQQIDFDAGTIHVVRLKGSRDTVQLLYGPELRALRKVQREYPDNGGYVFVTERGGPMTIDTWNDIVGRAGRIAGLPFPVHSHMLRHSLGHKLAADGVATREIQQALGHVNIAHTVRYTELANFMKRRYWKD